MTQMFSSSQISNINQDRYVGLCCCDKGQGKSLDFQGNQLGCITGHRTKQSIKIVPLRGDPSPQRQSFVTCPVHGNLENENELKRTENMDNAAKFSFKEVIGTWNNAVESAKGGRWDDAFNSFQSIRDYSAIMRFNLGQVAWVLENPQVAKENFTAAVEKDPHMALAHFQLGMVNYHLHRYNESRNSYEKSKTCLRGNRFIDYRQLGFVHKLYECEVLYNLALTYATMMNNSDYALELLEEARKVSVEARHGPLIEKAQQQLLTNQLYEPIVLPSNQLFRPNKSKVAGLKDVDYLGKAKVVSELPESSNNNNETNFQAPKKGLQLPQNTSFRPIDDDFSDDEGLSPTFNGSSSPTPSMVAKMTHKDTIATWYEGVVAFEKGDPTEALNQLNGIVDPSAKILYSIGILQKSLGQLEDASSTLKEVVSRDPHLAIGHFQLGVVLGLLGRCDDAWHAFEKARETLRGKSIDYKQLGLQYKLHKCEVLHNQAWAYNELDQKDWARNQLDEARECKAEPRHDKIDDSYRAFTSDRSFKLYELPKTLLFKPPKSKIDNLDRKDYLGKAKIVAKLPTVRRGSSTPPPPNTSSSLGVPVLTPRSRTPTPSSAPSKALPVPISKTQHLSNPALPGASVPSREPRPSLPDTQAIWKMPVVTVESLQNSKPPNRPPPSQSGGFNPNRALPQTPPPSSPVSQRALPGRKISSDLAPNRPIPSPARLSPVPDRPLPVSPGKKNSSEVPPSRPLPSPTRLSPVPDRPLPVSPGKKNSSEVPPSRPLPSPTRLSPVPDRPLPQRPVPEKTGDGPPIRPLPTPSRSSPVPASPVPQRPVPEQNGDLPPGRPLPTPNRSSPPPPGRPLPGPPQKSSTPELPQRPLPQTPSNSDNQSRPLSLADRPVPPRPGTASPELPDRQVPPPPGKDEPDLPPRPSPIATRTSDLSNRPVPPSPNAGRKLPGIPVMNSNSFDLPNRPIPALPTGGPPDDLPSRPPPPKPSQTMPELPPRPMPGSPVRQPSAESLQTRPVPLPPRSSTGEPELPPRPKPGSGNIFQDRPVPPPPSNANKLLNPGRRSSSPGLPELPPPPPPQRGQSPVPPRKQFNNHVASNGGKPAGNKAKLVKIVSDSPPVVRKAAAVTVTVQKEEKPAPASAAKPKPPTANKPNVAGNQPPILAFKPELKQRVGKGPGPNNPGKRKTALVIAAHQTDVEGEVSVAEGDLITITGEAGDWLEVEVKGRKGRVPRTCVKDFSKPGV